MFQHISLEGNHIAKGNIPVAISLIRSLLESLYQSLGQGSKFQHRYLIPILHPPFIQRVSPPPCVMLLKQKEQHYDERSRKGLEAPTYNIRCVMPATVCPTGRSYEKSSARQPHLCVVPCDLQRN